MSKLAKSRRKGSTAYLIAQQAADDDATSSMQEGHEGDVDGDVPNLLLMYFSYGEMVTCDSNDCEWEWFHLACVGLKVVPGSESMCALLIRNVASIANSVISEMVL